MCVLEATCWRLMLVFCGSRRIAKIKCLVFVFFLDHRLGIHGALFAGLCDKGYYCTSSAYLPAPNDNTTGAICPLFHICAAGSVLPQKCPIGYLANFTGMSACERCPAGFLCLPGEVPRLCPRGAWIDRSINWWIGWLVGWLIDWLIDQSIDWLLDWSIDWLIDWLIGWLIDWLIWLLTHDFVCSLFKYVFMIFFIIRPACYPTSITFFSCHVNW